MFIVTVSRQNPFFPTYISSQVPLLCKCIVFIRSSPISVSSYSADIDIFELLIHAIQGYEMCRAKEQNETKRSLRGVKKCNRSYIARDQIDANDRSHE